MITMKLTPLILSFVLGLSLTTTVQAQALSDLAGTWLNTHYIDGLKQRFTIMTGTVGKAAPLAVQIPAGKGEKITTTVFDGPAKGLTCTLEREKTAKDYVVKLGCGTGDSAQHWIVGLDERRQEYIALYAAADLDAPPTVYGRMPSKNQSLGFILERAVNASLLMGTYQDERGRTFTFRNDQTAAWPEATLRYHVAYDTDGTDTDYFTIDGAKPGSTRGYAFERTATTLKIFTLRTVKGHHTRGALIHTLTKR